jgi:hypothetical protein
VSLIKYNQLNCLDVVNASYRQIKMFQTLELESIAQTAHALMEQAAFSSNEFMSATHNRGK